MVKEFRKQNKNLSWKELVRLPFENFFNQFLRDKTF